MNGFKWVTFKRSTILRVQVQQILNYTEVVRHLTLLVTFDLGIILILITVGISKWANKITWHFSDEVVLLIYRSEHSPGEASLECIWIGPVLPCSSCSWWTGCASSWLFNQLCLVLVQWNSTCAQFKVGSFWILLLYFGKEQHPEPCKRICSASLHRDSTVYAEQLALFSVRESLLNKILAYSE